MLASVTTGALGDVGATDTPAALPSDLAYLRTGEYATRIEARGASSHHPVVLVCGAFESVAVWRPVGRLLAATTHVETYDFDGHGCTDHVGPYTTESQVAQLTHFLVARHLHHSVLAGPPMPPPTGQPSAIGLS